MADITRKLADIAKILGIPESECRLIADEYEVILPCKKIGKVRAYDENMVDRFRKIADLRAQGLPQEVITAAIRGGKTLEERALEDMKRMGIQTPKEPQMQAPNPAPRTETEEELILAVRSAETTVQTMDHRIATMREKIADDSAAVLDAVAEVAKEVAALRGEVHTLWDQIASLEQYFREQDAQKKSRFWKR
ncbi:MAG: MerR family transcriptional regulator [Methanocorpusculum sp.]|nr:MerR family transcriptional regulator [Methanocorpusculum sp.]